MKWLKRIVIAVVALIVLAVGILYFSLNSIIRSQVQTQASASLNLPTTLASARLALFGGSLSLHDLEVASPSSFNAPKIFTLNGVSVDASYSQLSNHPVHVKQIVIDSPRLVIEQSNGKLNLQALMDQIPQTPKSASGTPKEPMKLIIDDLQVNNAVVDFRPGLPLLSQDIEIPVPSLALKNIGNADGNQNGAAIKEVAIQVMTALAGKAGQDGKVPLDLNKFLATNLDQVSHQLGGEFNKQFQNVTGMLPKTLPGGAENPLLAPATQQSDKIQKDLQNDLTDLLHRKKK